MLPISRRVRGQDSSKRRFDTVRKHTLSFRSLISTTLVVLSKDFCHRSADPLLKPRHTSVQMRNNVQRWLSPSNVKDDLHRYQLEYMPGSCDWILEAPQAQDCLNFNHPTTMRVLGRPGSGKTVLASFLINHLVEQIESNVLYFFCKTGDLEKQATTHVL